MPEPVSTVAASLSIATNTFTTGKKLYTVFHGIKNAPRQVSRICLQLQALNTILGSLSMLIAREARQKQHDDAVVQQLNLLTDVLQSCEIVLLESRTIAEPLAEKLSSAGILGGAIWELFKKDELAELLATLDRYQNTLTLACQVLNTLQSATTKRTFEALYRKTRHLIGRIEGQADDQFLGFSRNRGPKLPNRHRDSLMQYLMETESVFSSSLRSSIASGDDGDAEVIQAFSPATTSVTSNPATSLPSQARSTDLPEHEKLSALNSDDTAPDRAFIEVSNVNGVALGQSEQIPFLKDYYSDHDVHPGDKVSVLWEYQPRVGDEFELERGDMLNVIAIWDDGWATGVWIDERAEDYDGKQKIPRDSGVPSGDTQGDRERSPTSLKEIKAFPLVCVCLPEAWRRNVEGEGDLQTNSGGVPF